MSVALTPRQRALRCVRWQPYDAVPIYSPVPFSPQAWAEGRLAPWQDNDRYREIAALVARRDRGDLPVSRVPLATDGSRPGEERADGRGAGQPDRVQPVATQQVHAARDPGLGALAAAEVMSGVRRAR